MSMGVAQPQSRGNGAAPTQPTGGTWMHWAMVMCLFLLTSFLFPNNVACFSCLGAWLRPRSHKAVKELIYHPRDSHRQSQTQGGMCYGDRNSWETHHFLDPRIPGGGYIGHHGPGLLRNRQAEKGKEENSRERGRERHQRLFQDKDVQPWTCCVASGY